MKFSSFHILFLILLYPFFYASSYIAFNVGYLFSVYYFIPVTLFLVLLNIRKIPLGAIKQNGISFSILLAIVLLVLFNTNDLRYSKPFVFFIFVFNIYLLSLSLKLKVNNKLIQILLGVLLLLSLFFLSRPERYTDDRYTSFLLTPTVYSVYTEIFLILFLFYSRQTRLKIVVFVIVGLFILMTKTRLNMFFYITIPFMLFYLSRMKGAKLQILVIYIICLNSLYPIYSLLIKSEAGQSSLVSSRYEDGRDASFGLRNYLNDFTYEEYISNSTTFQKLFGKGTEASRKVIISKMDMDALPHNDFIRFTMDFGLVASFLFLIFLYRIARKNSVSFVLLLLYLFSFYHNMIYDFFLIALIIYFGNVEEKEEFQENNILVV